MPFDKKKFTQKNKKIHSSCLLNQSAPAAEANDPKSSVVHSHKHLLLTHMYMCCLGSAELRWPQASDLDKVFYVLTFWYWSWRSSDGLGMFFLRWMAGAKSTNGNLPCCLEPKLRSGTLSCLPIFHWPMCVWSTVKEGQGSTSSTVNGKSSECLTNIPS